MYNFSSSRCPFGFRSPGRYCSNVYPGFANFILESVAHSLQFSFEIIVRFATQGCSIMLGTTLLVVKGVRIEDGVVEVLGEGIGEQGDSGNGEVVETQGDVVEGLSDVDVNLGG